MECVKIFIVLILIFLFKYSSNSDDASDEKTEETIALQSLISDKTHLYKKPSVVIVSLIRNKAHTLPLFLTYLEEQDYPKDRISLWIVTDHNEDNSKEILEVWLRRARNFYHSIHYQHDDSEKLRRGETNMTHWPEERFLEIIRLKEDALIAARKAWADYIFFIDADVFLTSSASLSTLISLNRPIIAPMLSSEGLYSNFWCGMSSDYYYKRTDDYKKIRNYEMVGEFPVPMIHSSVLIDLNRFSSDLLTFNKTKLNSYHNQKFYDGPIDDIIIFAISANFSNTEMTISNSHAYGFILVPLDQDEPMTKDEQQLKNTKVSIINQHNEIHVVPELQKYVKYPNKSKLTFSDIYMINLKRRSERRVKMEQSFKELGIDYTYLEAVDGKTLTDEVLIQKGINLLPEYADPYHKRPMTMGEIGCFLSHHTIWQKMIEKGQEEVLVLEDDIKFEPYFNERSEQLLEEARAIGGWDLIYFGRKRLHENEEFLEKSENFVKVSYTYWTLGYALTLAGAKKLLAAEPLKRLLPVDEFLPIMFDQHPNDTWKMKYEKRNLVAWSVSPLLLYPTHYTGEDGYISDTEDSKQIQIDLANAASEALKGTINGNILNQVKHDPSEL
ncbi:CLUMA_CG002249, isoform A [Clunio marinus]|uniref:CLUMA_CG002249, isoform A n=1 Tax=Clunio marinus TaxID=568069 RepID=A0A1J1HKL9_9DIPT|nr:CLUMA_CG002249, isoform A [Clunio marinus]